MVSAEKEKQQVAEGLTVSRRQLGDASRDLRVAFDPRRWASYLAKLLRKYLYAWMSFAAMVGWVLSRIPPKKQKVYVHPSGTGDRARGLKTLFRAGENNGQAKPEILSLAMDLVTAVGVSLLQRKAKSWPPMLFAKRKKSGRRGPSSRKAP